jgi:myo-inositol-hexaphosphate 3-phosphohydrolase
VSRRVAGWAALLAGPIVGLLALVPIACAQPSRATHPSDGAETVISPQLTLADSAARDQDDMCFWIHPTDRSLSTIITSDKAARKLFVYDLQGATLQVITMLGQPGNIDIRYDFLLSGAPVDIVAVNDRNNRKILIYRVDPATRQLVQVDGGHIGTALNYGICLYRSASGTYYAFTTSESGAIEQYELYDRGGGQVGAIWARGWSFGTITEGCVCDDETAAAYFAQEDVGIWKLGAEPWEPVTASKIAAVGDSGLTADVEGLTIYYAAGAQGYLIASSQGSDNFKVYQRRPPHAYQKTVKVAGVKNTDGIDVTSVRLGPAFRAGAFAAHNDSLAHKTVEVCAYQELGLLVDTLYWDPRRGPGPVSAGAQRGPELALRVLRARAAKATPVVELTLPDARPGALEVFDVAGRRIWSRRVEGLGQGTHRVELAGPKPLRAGFYVVRLRHGARSITTRVLVTR